METSSFEGLNPEMGKEQETNIEVSINLEGWDGTEKVLRGFIKQSLVDLGYIVRDVSIFPHGIVVASLGKGKENLIVSAILPDGVTTVLDQPGTEMPKFCTFIMQESY
ncbi:MAG: hypothetical protein A2445_05595 [Candidatus Jacksonbacteria bacterium RIFOXYC2_FULL_44_29]|nr:MAG: hypothetical protein UW45_C0008G0004 [Parcubacteria group bacterium GW2011_GWC2_44_22]OGY76755.1 MAG: hypothetical protein A2295_00245 [Candidatus Jacksonbacteria bacterium RIFOXYB2_FULL_44_15]OGY79161.1 MAG: hypothetical protein A2445_05595 [Candidatus Jacksonbacteria bacterium RIFOXYC2_FULL_44_29]HBH46331.1 hypothetical protein [Candidatus Jacksonbacteria bacterium]HCR15479.1 hypothetical protein [Candidatus Jacksonbacteria bacterium]